MRKAFQLAVAAGLLVAGVTASAAFTRVEASRAIVVHVVGDGSAYLALGANGESPHRCFVGSTNGRTTITFGAIASPCTNGGGTGLNPGDGTTGAQHARYAFHDLLTLTNQGTRTLLVWVNATTSSGGGSAVHVAGKSTSGAMADADYAAGLATPLTLATGAVAYLGVRVDTGSLASGGVFGNLTLEARRT